MMNTKFKEIDMYEALCLAVSIGEERSDFYEKLSEQTDKSQVKTEILFLRDEERRNTDYFAHRLEEEEDPGDAGSCDPEKKLHRWVENEIIVPFQKAREGTAVSGSMEALRLGAELQKLTIEFYRELLLHEKEEKKAELSDLLSSEEQHLKKLNIIMSY